VARAAPMLPMPIEVTVAILLVEVLVLG
jgi:hypothetical protein